MTTRCSHCHKLMLGYNDGDSRCSSCAEAGDLRDLTLMLADGAEAEFTEQFGDWKTAAEYVPRLVAEIRRLQARIEDLESSLAVAESDAMVRAQEGD